MPEKAGALYPYPAVQYIPLIMTTVAEEDWDPPAGLDRVALAIGKNDPNWREFLRRAHGLTMPPLTLASGEVLLLSLNMRIVELKYRGHFVTGRADLAPGRFQLLRMSQNVFYKDRIIFEIYGREGTRLCWQAWDRMPRRIPLHEGSAMQRSQERAR